jgi:hypothetical protein
MKFSEYLIKEARADVVRAWNEYKSWIDITVCADEEFAASAVAARDDAKDALQASLSHLHEVTVSIHSKECQS